MVTWSGPVAAQHIMVGAERERQREKDQDIKSQDLIIHRHTPQ
jgi:hypothetical protein